MTATFRKLRHIATSMTAELRAMPNRRFAQKRQAPLPAHYDRRIG
jgi:hypothetical protein